MSIDHLPDLPPAIQLSWDRYASFLQQQRLKCYANHRIWNDLPKHLLDQLENFILPVEQLIDFSAPPHLIHADLTEDHLRCLLVNGRWQDFTIIDWGDAMTGNLLYELVALHMDLFKADKRLLSVCLDQYGLPDFFRQDFHIKALCMALLHQFPVPVQVYASYSYVQTLTELADGIFAV